MTHKILEGTVLKCLPVGCTQLKLFNFKHLPAVTEPASHFQYNTKKCYTDSQIGEYENSSSVETTIDSSDVSIHSSKDGESKLCMCGTVSPYIMGGRVLTFCGIGS